MERVDAAHEKYVKLANERDNILTSLNGYITRINITSSEKQAENYYKKAQQLLEKYKILASTISFNALSNKISCFLILLNNEEFSLIT